MSRPPRVLWSGRVGVAKQFSPPPPPPPPPPQQNKNHPLLFDTYPYYQLLVILLATSTDHTGPHTKNNGITQAR